MWPWGHLGFGYLLYSLSNRALGRGAPTNAAAIALAFGTQFPDLVDKPLAWWLGVLPSGRSLAHSLLFGGVVMALVWVALSRRGYRDAGWAFVVGYLSHLLGDSFVDLSAQKYERLTFLLWPILPPVDYGNEGLGGLLSGFSLTRPVVYGLLLATLTVCLWLFDGHPGMVGIGRLYRRLRGTDG